MKKLLQCLLLSTLAGSFVPLFSQNITVSPGNGNYPTLAAAFNAIAGGSHTGNVTVTITGNTTETQSAGLSLPGNVTSVLIRPLGNRTVSGDIAGAPLVDINGADNVTIDGLNTNGNSLTITNTSTASTMSTSTLMIRNDAANVTVRNCTILGSGLVSGPTIGGTVFIGNTLFSLSATGNDNLVFENNQIGPAGSNYPAKALHCNGYASNQPSFQERIRFTGNKIFDFFSATGNSHGMLIQVSKSVWIIRDNHFYQTSAKTHTANLSTQTVLETNGATSTGTALIENNTIGYASANKTGRYEIFSPGLANRWYGIRLAGAGATARGNTITAITIDGAPSGSGQTNPFSAIFAGDGAKVISNTIGNAAKSGDIAYTSSAVAQSWIYGIWASGNSGNMRIDSNTIAGIRTSGGPNTSINLIGAYVRTAGADTNYIRHNMIGSAEAPLENLSPGTNTRTLGIRSEQSHCVIYKNTIQNLSVITGNIGSTTGNPITGIEVSSSSGTVAASSMTISGNTIHNLRSDHASSSGWIKGIDFQGPAGGNHSISGNFIHNLLIPVSSSASATVAGINTNHSINPSVKGNTVIANNMIALGTALTTNLVRVFGVFETTSGNDMQYYFNTIFIGGAVASGTQSQSVGISSSTTRTFLNNIIVNNRVNTTGTSKHYAITLSGTSISPAFLSNRNVLVSSGVLVRYNNIDYTTLANWQAISGHDANSVSADPLLAAPTAATPDLHLSQSGTSPAENLGTPVTGITLDIDGDIRSATPDAGADEKNNPLPVNWGRLDVTVKGAYHEIFWTTQTESNNRGFEVETSADGIRFTSIGFVPSKALNGHSTIPLHYQHTNATPSAGTNWYRIKQTDKDGRFSYSRIVRAGELNMQPLALKAWPNPAMDRLQIALKGSFNPHQTDLKLVNLQGKTLWSSRLLNENQTIAVNQLPAGMYILMVTENGSITTQQKVMIR